MTIQALKPVETPLGGKSLIEASAGTGKTYTIAALYLRLILEQRLTVQQILVVTFTNAATTELRDRLRTRLAQAYEKFAGVDGGHGDAFLDDLYEKIADREDAAKRLLIALRNFDECAVFTIHGFCGSLLKEAALESGLPLEQEMQMDDSDVRQRIADDFWRRHFRDATPALLDLLRRQSITPEDLLSDVDAAVSKPYLVVHHDENAADFDALTRQLDDAYRAVQQTWRDSGDEVSDIILTHENLNRSSYNRKNAPAWLDWIARHLSESEPGDLETDRSKPSGFCTKVERFMTSGLAVKNGCEPPAHRFFDLWEDYVRAHARVQASLDALLNHLRYELLLEIRSTLAEEKKKTGVMSPDDILLGLHEALRGEAAARLIRQARKRFPAALIDEFQDTDPVQYDIFNALSGGDSGNVFYVGDPKQAIYGFRGADVFTYLKARDQLEASGDGALWTLDTNWRSTGGVVAAVNALFGEHERPFWLKDMAYQPVKASSKELGEIQALVEQRGSFRLLTLDADKPVSSGEAKQVIAEAVADDIAELLTRAAQAGWRIGERTFGGGDIAILVRGHAEADIIKTALGKRGVACVQASKNSVFESEQARQLAILMTAVVHGNNESHIRLALATELFGFSAGMIADLGENAGAWDDWLERFSRWRTLWRNRGFSVMFRHVLQQQGVYQRLLALPDGERRLTDLLHLAELLNQEALQQSLGMESLLRWLHHACERAAKEKNAPDERKLRLESDENLVTISTIHASKGLEYNVVYCPFLWSARQRDSGDAPFMFHNPDRGFEPSLELGSEQRAHWLEIKQEEAFADDLRLLYVAVTRAVQHCTIVSGNIKGSENSALAWLLHARDFGAEIMDQPLSAIREMIKQRVQQAASSDGLPGALSSAIQTRPIRSRDAIRCLDLKTAPPTGQPRQFRGELADISRVTSYSGLVSGSHSEQPDYDFLAGRGDQKEDLLRGPQAGSCLHAVLEYLVFGEAVAAQAEQVGATLAQFGFDRSLTDRVVCWLQDVLDTPLFPESGFCLAKLAESERLNEMEFWFPVAGLDTRGLKDILARHYAATGFEQASQRLGFGAVSGYLKGFIDLIYRRDGRYYLVDYKSNWLAPEALDYTRDVMQRAIADQHYYLQYLIYTVALHRYLKLKIRDYDYESHFGGVQYLFLRGMSPGSGANTGVYFDRPSLTLVEELEEWLT